MKTNEHLIASLRAEKDELESSLSKEKSHTLQLKQDLAEAETRSTDLYKVIINTYRYLQFGFFLDYIVTFYLLLEQLYLFSWIISWEM